MSLGQAQTGSKRSIPKAGNVKAADDKKILFKNMGNNHSYPMMWAETITMSGTSYLLASGIAFHGMELASNCNVIATARQTHTAPIYIERNASENTLTLKSSANVVGDVDVQYILGGNATAGYIASYDCRANTGATKNF